MMILIIIIIIIIIIMIRRRRRRRRRRRKKDFRIWGEGHWRFMDTSGLLIFFQTMENK